MTGIEKAVTDLKQGKFIVLYDGDGREGECDLIFHAAYATPQHVATLRKDGGGLICLATSQEMAQKIGLPYMSDILQASNNPLLNEIAVKRSPYGDVPAFSITINHKKAYTGVTDTDRSIAMSDFAKIVTTNNGLRHDFVDRFVSPGHLHLLIGRNLKERRGHTELALELAKRAHLPPAMVLCEMMDVGNALSKEEAKRYAEKHGIAFLEGKELVG